MSPIDPYDLMTQYSSQFFFLHIGNYPTEILHKSVSLSRCQLVAYKFIDVVVAKLIGKV